MAEHLGYVEITREKAIELTALLSGIISEENKKADAYVEKEWFNYLQKKRTWYGIKKYPPNLTPQEVITIAKKIYERYTLGKTLVFSDEVYLAKSFLYPYRLLDHEIVEASSDVAAIISALAHSTSAVITLSISRHHALVNLIKRHSNVSVSMHKSDVSDKTESRPTSTENKS